MAQLKGLLNRLPTFSESLMVSNGFGVWLAWKTDLIPAVPQTLSDYGGLKVAQERRQSLWFFFFERRFSGAGQAGDLGPPEPHSRLRPGGARQAAPGPQAGAVHGPGFGPGRARGHDPGRVRGLGASQGAADRAGTARRLPGGRAQAQRPGLPGMETLSGRPAVALPVLPGMVPRAQAPGQPAGQDFSGRVARVLRPDRGAADPHEAQVPAARVVPDVSPGKTYGNSRPGARSTCP